MKRSILAALLSLLLVQGASWFSGAAAAPAAPAAAASGLCVALAIDDSDSMQRSDPQNLRSAGARLFVALLDRGDRVGLLSFAERPTRLAPGMILLDGAEQQQELLGRITARPPRGYTDLRLALSEALDLLQSASGCQERRLVLLSDGQPDLPGGLPEGYEDQAVQLLRQANIPLLGIALTPAGETPLLYRLAQASGPQGAVLPARDAGALLDAYLDALGRIQDRTVLDAGAPDAQGFLALPLAGGLAQYIERSAFILALPAAGLTPAPDLAAPGGEKLPAGDPRLAFAYTSDPRLAVYAVDQPAPGEWGFRLPAGAAARGWLLLRSRLRVRLLEPAAYHPLGRPMLLAASLVEQQADGRRITLAGDALLSARVRRPDGSRLALDQLFDDGTHGDALRGDGIYSALYSSVDQAGEYQVEITAHKGLIPAQAAGRVQVTAFPIPGVISPGATVRLRGQPLELAVRLEGGSPPRLDSGGFIARLSGPGGWESSIPLILQGQVYRASLPGARPGLYSIDFLPQDAFYKGVPYRLSARRQVEISSVPRLDLPEAPLDLGWLEPGELDRGVQARLPIRVSGAESETVRYELAGVPGLELLSAAPASLQNGSSTVRLALRGRLAAGAYRAELLLTTRPGVDLPRRSLPVIFQVYQPQLALSSARLAAGAVAVGNPVQALTVTLVITSSSHRAEPFTLQWQGPDGTALAGSGGRQISPGESLALPVRLHTAGLAPGEYRGRLLVSGRDGLKVVPPQAQVIFRVKPGPWCGAGCRPLAGCAAALLLAAAGWAGWRLSRPRPWGVLQPRQSPSGLARPAPVSLGKAGGRLSGGVVVAGSGGGAHIRLAAQGVQKRHAAFMAQRRPVLERIGRPPRSIAVQKTGVVVCSLSSGLLRVGGVEVPHGGCSAPLSSGVRVQIGPYEFEYRE